MKIIDAGFGNFMAAKKSKIITRNLPRSPASRFLEKQKVSHR